MTNTKVRITNRNKFDMLLRIEPWGSEVKIAQMQSVEVVFSGSEDRAIEIEYNLECVTIYGWEGSIFELSSIE
jgi:hypothetical protein